MTLPESLRAHALAAKGFMPPDEGDALGHTPLMDAAGNGDVEIVAWLLGKGASLRKTDAQGRTALFRAVLGGSVAPGDTPSVAPTAAPVIELPSAQP